MYKYMNPFSSMSFVRIHLIISSITSCIEGVPVHSDPCASFKFPMKIPLLKVYCLELHIATILFAHRISLKQVNCVMFGDAQRI